MENTCFVTVFVTRNTRVAGGKQAELIEAATDKAAERERDRRMREINSANEASDKKEAESRSVPTLGEFSKTLWMVYLKNKRVKHSTVDSYGSVLRHHLSPVFENKRLDEITPAELSIFFDELGRKVSTKFILNIYANSESCSRLRWNMI